MNAIAQSPTDCSNLLLSRLPESDYQALLPHLELVDTPLHFTLFERDKPIPHVYFPLTGGHSVLATMEDGSAVEIGTVGYEGFAAVDLIMGSDIAVETTVCQIPGTALRMPAEVFMQMAQGDTPLRRIALRYLHAYLGMVSQSAACNRLHALEHRLARWLLMCHDRMGHQDFFLTQEYLAAMLGVQRPSVSVVASVLQRAGIIDYKRGKVQILDRKGLEETSCECYGIVQGQFARLLGKGF
ncbi:cAMP-binding domain of CRP or a regulatory subunit of cAMP-dependent protein kinases [Noviherbaspirillum humi]|uniref:cAMP-binding domain of CRP or a regulatory subunit of cAMP-dependent protein kinases n=1 Tax=Noviherbaspirillum humi TaxID=1688639 RepID=A0A239M129_9BURK|nr:Crp/Fnr family transcriptional regulator [Noviherbaspirillum humi]SNT35609.1 cAMP-binding domain of CRP or a regulatory subunit of cAMP-dependent protein kinases [Noviherbaspirillum humi]